VLSIGLLVNPYAGIGGRVALKGSDDVVAEALARGALPRAPGRIRRTLETVGAAVHDCRWSTWGGPMGADYLEELDVEASVLGDPASPSSAEDSRGAVAALIASGIDLLIFAGGDGTARDVLEAADDRLPVLGVPAGVKMHSGVFATTPERAGELLDKLISGGLVQSVRREVRDLDEHALREGRLEPRYYGELRVPEPGGYLQHTKVSGRESEPLVLEEIIADVTERLRDQPRPVILGPGSTLSAIKSALGMQATLLGMDVWQAGKQLAADASGDWLDEHLHDPIVVLSFTRSQGFLLGRGNQQLSPTLLGRLDRGDLIVVGTRTKLASLEGRPLLIDTDDPALDGRLAGLIEITTGYEDRLFYRLESHA
jgi:predicted polyphosphate/ATP-dependent NAD kinase